MPSPLEALERWRAAGLVDDATAGRIRDFEARREREAGDDRPSVLEALIYLGVAIVVMGIVVLAGENWQELENWARIAVLALPGALAILAGQALRSFKEPGLVRGGHMAWLAATALLGGAAAVFGETLDWEEVHIAMGAGVAGTAVALVLWALAPSHPQVLGLGGGLFTAAISLTAYPDDENLLLGGGAVAVLGIAGIALTELGFVTPRISARAVFGAMLAFGAFFAGFEAGEAEVIGFAAAIGLVVLSVARGGLAYTLEGVAAGFAALFRSIIVHVEDPTAAALALVVVGVLMVATVIAVTRFRPWHQGEPA